MKMVKTSWAVQNISMKSPCEIEVPAASVVDTLSPPGKRAETTAEADIAPKSCEMATSRPRPQVKAPIRHMPNVT